MRRDVVIKQNLRAVPAQHVGQRVFCHAVEVMDDDVVLRHRQLFDWLATHFEPRVVPLGVNGAAQPHALQHLIECQDLVGNGIVERKGLGHLDDPAFEVGVEVHGQAYLVESDAASAEFASCDARL